MNYALQAVLCPEGLDEVGTVHPNYLQVVGILVLEKKAVSILENIFLFV